MQYADIILKIGLLTPTSLDNSIEEIKSFLYEILDYVIEYKSIYDHGWEPDLDAVLYRYSMLFPNDNELLQLKNDYYNAIHNPKFFTKFEPPTGITEIGIENIVRKTMLKKVYLPNGLKHIKPETFKGCCKLEDLFIPDSVLEIGKSAFEDSNLKKIHLSNSIIKMMWVSKVQFLKLYQHIAQ